MGSGADELLTEVAPWPVGKFRGAGGDNFSLLTTMYGGRHTTISDQEPTP